MIGTRNESSLHAALKEYYRQPGDEVEGNVDGYVIDLIQSDRLIEIQTANFSAIKEKLGRLLQQHSVHVVFPIAAERQLVKIHPTTGEILQKRKSPKRGTVYELFSELLRIPHLLRHPRFSVEAVLILDQEIRCADGRGSWRRRGMSIVDRCLLEVKTQHVFSTLADYSALIPKKLAEPFTNRELAGACEVKVPLARKMTYTLKKAGVLEEVGKNGREILHRRLI